MLYNSALGFSLRNRWLKRPTILWSRVRNIAIYIAILLPASQMVIIQILDDYALSHFINEQWKILQYILQYWSQLVKHWLSRHMVIAKTRYLRTFRKNLKNWCLTNDVTTIGMISSQAIKYFFHMTRARWGASKNFIIWTQNYCTGLRSNICGLGWYYFYVILFPIN